MKLAPDVHLADADGRLIFLDVRRDRYGGATDAQAAALRSGAQDPILEPLVEDGLLVDDGGPWAVMTCAWPPPNRDMSSEPACTSGGLRDIVRAFGALWRADRRLRRRPLLALMPSVPASAAPPLALLAGFKAARGWYPRDRNCLFDALALLTMLQSAGHRPDWVFGVRGLPFAAHCWLESDGLVLNDRLENVLPFTPIMVV